MISSGPIKVLATRDQVVGQVKVTVGKTIGNHRMEAEGHKQQDHGTAEKQAAAAKHTADGTSDRLLCQDVKFSAQRTGNNEKWQRQGHDNERGGKRQGDVRDEIRQLEVALLKLLVARRRRRLGPSVAAVHEEGSFAHSFTFNNTWCHQHDQAAVCGPPGSPDRGGHRCFYAAKAGTSRFAAQCPQNAQYDDNVCLSDQERELFSTSTPGDYLHGICYKARWSERRMGGGPECPDCQRHADPAASATATSTSTASSLYASPPKKPRTSRT
ncbi:hypothetical protein JKP88DRAFT_348246 [Tribonema minus]|uniref:Uncharacterized protein n=1 Tax=Tribonema minus TaxID=303371 RepID=A0A835Z2J6_9STRA|nr:hypothetical protein JKP88DRAFT_348246 [Tribonema minus]